jgi:hypothetical protein
MSDTQLTIKVVKEKENPIGFDVFQTEPTSLERIQGQFPGATGLKFCPRDKSKDETILAVKDDNIYPSGRLWQTDTDGIYHVTFKANGNFLNFNKIWKVILKCYID